VNYAGPVCPVVQALCINGADGKLMALVFSHACDCDAPIHERDHISAGWPGAAVESLKARFRAELADGGVREGALPLFLSGCCADVQPIRQGTWETMRTNGQRVADAAHAARWNAHGRQDEELGFTETQVALPAAEGMPADTLKMICFRLGGIRLLAFPVAASVQYQLELAEQSTQPLLTISRSNGFLDRLVMSANCPTGAFDNTMQTSEPSAIVRSAETELAIRRGAYELLDIDATNMALYAAPPFRTAGHNVDASLEVGGTDSRDSTS
jgi:hypothetical protein